LRIRNKRTTATSALSPAGLDVVVDGAVVVDVVDVLAVVVDTAWRSGFESPEHATVERAIAATIHRVSARGVMTTSGVRRWPGW
jgi:hypothetical protein